MSLNECQYPERRPKDGICSPELQEKCHGKQCEHPERIPANGVCSPQSIEECQCMKDK